MDFYFLTCTYFAVILLKTTSMLVLLFLAILVSGCTQQQPQQQTTTTTGTGSGTAREISVQMSQFKFAPDPIVIKKGERIMLKVTSVDVPHGFSLPDFGVNVTPLAGEAKTAEFVADKSGTFTVRCSVFCGSGHPTMTGKLIVQE